MSSLSVRFAHYILTPLKESFYSKLKTFADEHNTNLYVSNLPKSMNEHELSNLFLPHKVCSSRVLREKNGHGRGVGFARSVVLSTHSMLSLMI